MATSLALLGLAVAIGVLLFPGEHGQKNHFVKGNNTAGTFVSSKEGSYERNSTVVPQGLSCVKSLMVCKRNQNRRRSNDSSEKKMNEEKANETSG